VVVSFDNVQHYLLLEKVARRVQDDAAPLGGTSM
jgi:hypothetical protein